MNENLKRNLPGQWIFALGIALAFLYSPVQGQQKPDLPYDLSALVGDMKDDHVANNATAAFSTILKSGSTLSRKQENRVARRLGKIIKNGDRQQAILSAGILSRWGTIGVLSDQMEPLLIKLLKSLLSNPSATLRQEGNNVLNYINRDIYTPLEGEEKTKKRINRTLNQITWRGTKKERKRIALKAAQLLKADCSSEKLIKWVMKNLNDDDVRSNAHRALRYVTDIKTDHVLPYLKEGLRSKDYQKRQYCAIALGNFHTYEPTKKYIQTMVNGLHDDRIGGILNNAKSFTFRLQELGVRAHPYLKKALRAKDDQQLQLAAWILSNSPHYEPSEEYIKVLVNALDGGYILAHSGGGPFSGPLWSYDLIMKLGERAHPYLVNALDSESRHKRQFAAQALIESGDRENLSREISILMEQLKDDDVGGNGLSAGEFIRKMKHRPVYEKIQSQLKSLVRSGTPQQCAAAIHLLPDRALPDAPPSQTVKRIKKYTEINRPQMGWLRSGIKYCGDPVYPLVNQRIRKILKRQFHRLKTGYALRRRIVKNDLRILYDAKERLDMYLGLLKFFLGHEHVEEEESKDVKILLEQVWRRTNKKRVVKKYLEKRFSDQPTNISQKAKEMMEDLGTRRYSDRERATRYFQKKGPGQFSILAKHFPTGNPETDKRIIRITFPYAISWNRKKFEKLYKELTE